jgi:hypothetical protein
MKTIVKFALSVAAAALMFLPATAQTGGDKGKKGATAATQTPAKPATKSATAPAATDQEIADAKAKGLVWVNTSSKVYHTEGQFYGKTKQGKFMTKDEAEKAGYRAAKEGAAGKKSTAAGAAPASTKGGKK